ncbi:MAG: hypothetical protein LBH64_04700, partial [Coriobacteriales bacterium]|nr:hypothetical protein [Coriobacteriales bacterium]
NGDTDDDSWTRDSSAQNHASWAASARAAITRGSDAASQGKTQAQRASGAASQGKTQATSKQVGGAASQSRAQAASQSKAQAQRASDTAAQRGSDTATTQRAADAAGAAGAAVQRSAAGAAAQRSAAATTQRAAGARSATLARAQNFQPTRYRDSSYYIRGGGGHHNPRSIALFSILGGIIVIAAVLLTIFLVGAYDDIVKEKPDENIVTLSPEETREAIDSQMPRLFDYLSGTTETAMAAFTEAGWNVVAGSNLTSLLDSSALGGRIIHLPPATDPAIVENRYSAGGLSAYDFDELQRSFNGAWALDVFQGNLGSSDQIEYVNFAATSLDAELAHLREVQGLSGPETSVDSQGTDDHDNSFIRGFTVIDGVTYYWEVIGIAFSEYYAGQDRRDLPDTSVFVKCKLATFDFYGVGTAAPGGTGGETGSGGGGEGEGGTAGTPEGDGMEGEGGTEGDGNTGEGTEGGEGGEGEGDGTTPEGEGNPEGQ